MQRVAQGRLSFERSGAATVVRDAYAESPLRLLTPANHGGSAWAYTSTLGGGFVDGDRVRLRISVGEGARAFVSTQGPTRIYRSPGGCESETTSSVAKGGALVLAPDPTACFAGARFLQRTEVDLAEDASVALWDALSAGRSARGERWAFDRCTLRFAVRRSGRTLLEESWLLDPAHGALSDRLGRFEGLATVLLAGPLFAAARETLRTRLEAQPPAPRARLLESASFLAPDVAVVRLAGASVEELVCALRARFVAVPALLGDDPWARRA
ncbi:MAG: urease accessory protein UreD [Myxococcales bacterium]